jgi:hypothetical protein
VNKHRISPKNKVGSVRSESPAERGIHRTGQVSLETRLRPMTNAYAECPGPGSQSDRSGVTCAQERNCDRPASVGLACVVPEGQGALSDGATARFEERCRPVTAVFRCACRNAV